MITTLKNEDAQLLWVDDTDAILVFPGKSWVLLQQTKDLISIPHQLIPDLIQTLHDAYYPEDSLERNSGLPFLYPQPQKMKDPEAVRELFSSCLDEELDVLTRILLVNPDNVREELILLIQEKQTRLELN